MTLSAGEEQTAKIVNDLFKRLEGIIPAFDQGRSPQKMEQIKREWVKEFMAQRLSDLTTIERGLSKLRSEGLTFLPPVAHFITLCRGVPELKYWDDIKAEEALNREMKSDNELLRSYIHAMRYFETPHGEKLLNSFFKNEKEKAYAKRLYDRFTEQKERESRRKYREQKNTKPTHVAEVF